MGVEVHFAPRNIFCRNLCCICCHDYYSFVPPTVQAPQDQLPWPPPKHDIGTSGTPLAQEWQRNMLPCYLNPPWQQILYIITHAFASMFPFPNLFPPITWLEWNSLPLSFFLMQLRTLHPLSLSLSHSPLLCSNSMPRCSYAWIYLEPYVSVGKMP